jgi:hypothetical protein
MPERLQIFSQVLRIAGGDCLRWLSFLNCRLSVPEGEAGEEISGEHRNKQETPGMGKSWTEKGCGLSDIGSAFQLDLGFSAKGTWEG